MNELLKYLILFFSGVMGIFVLILIGFIIQGMWERHKMKKKGVEME